MISLLIEADGLAPRTVSVERFPCRIGRHRGAEVVLDSWRVARWHAEIHRMSHGFKLIDLGSLGGTWVNAERIVEYAPLAEIDEIVIAGYRLRVFAGGNSSEVQRFDDAGRDSSATRIARNASIDSVEHDAHDSASGNRGSLPISPPDTALEWRRVLHRRLLQTIDLRRKDVRQLSAEQLRAEARAVLDELVAAEASRIPGIDVDRLVSDVLDEAVGLGPLEPLLADADVGEIMVNRADEIYVERDGRITRSGLRFSSEAAVRAVIDRIVAPLGRRIDESSPMVDARLPDGSRVNAVIPPLAVRGSALTIRRFNRQVLSPSDLLGLGSASEPMLRFLHLCVEHRRNIVISGGTGSGKTTLLNVLSNLIPEGERIVTIEDAAELRLRHAHLVSLEARPSNSEGQGAVGIRDLVRNALRMRPDRIVVGECRGGEALDMLQAMNTGHEGSLTTVHANSPRDVIARLETMVLMAGIDLPVAAIRDQIGSAIQIVVQQARGADGRRRIVEIAEITGLEAMRVQMQPLFRWERGRFACCDTIPQFLEGLRAQGLNLDWGTLCEEST